MLGGVIGIVDYGLGNLASVVDVVERLRFTPSACRRTRTGTCAKLILPRIGAFWNGMRNLREKGLIDPLSALVVGKGMSILDICPGTQLMTRSSEEVGWHDGLGWIDGTVTRIEPDGPRLRVPHVGRNDSGTGARTRIIRERTRRCAVLFSAMFAAIAYRPTRPA